MPWTEQNQKDAQLEADGYGVELGEKYTAWLSAVQSGAPTTGSALAAVEDVMRRWQQSISSLQSQSEAIVGNDSVMDALGQLATQVAEEKSTLQKLRNEAITRTDQADSVNPKVRASPYTNILGLDRVFRDSTRFWILITSIIFGVLALGALGFLVYQVVSTGALVPMQYIQGGTGRSKN